MLTPAEKIVKEAMILPVEARAQLAHKLIKSLDGSVDENTEDEWMAEIDRRCKEVETGAVVCKPTEEVLNNIRKKLQDVCC